MKYIKYVAGLAAFVLSVCLVRAQTTSTGTADVDITGGVNNVVATWAAVKTAMIPIGVFLLAWAFFKRLRRA